MVGRPQELSVLFADVSGSAKLYEKLGDTEALHAVDRCIKRMERSVEGFRGRIVKVAGDELLAVFAVAEDAFHAACDMQQRIADLPPVSGVKLSIRIGFHQGPAIEGKDGCTGEAVNVAARLAGLARAEQVLTSGATVAELPELLQLSTRDVQLAAGKGKVDGLKLVEVLWHGSEVFRTPEPVAELPAAAKRKAPTKPVAAAVPVPPPLGRISLRHAGKVFVLDELHPLLLLGRDAASDVVIRDRRASRQHAKIERRGNEYVLSDRSTNGTYVSFAGQPEILLRRGEVILRGNGRMSFAASAASEGADIAEFEYLA